jgi:hypothetical protein
MRQINRASSSIFVAACLSVAAAASLNQALSQMAPSPNPSASLNYEFFKAKVEPVFLTKRPGHARCVVCHTLNNAAFHLVALSPGSMTWNDAQSRMNFELIKRVAMPGYLESRLLIHPLAEQAGGDPHHGGGQQFESKNDPDWQTLKAFVLGAKAN